MVKGDRKILKHHWIEDDIEGTNYLEKAKRRKEKMPFKKGHKINLGRKHTEETKRKIGEKSKGRKHTEEHKMKMSEKFTGKRNPFYNKHHTKEAKEKISQSNWKGGKIKDNKGYIYVYSPNHPYAIRNNRYVAEHRLIMERHLGRILLPTEVVHHINGDVSDNRIENLMLFSSNGKHTSYHKKNGNKKI